MTGFARVRRAVGPAELTVSLKSVNHRGLDLHFHMPPMLDPFEPVARAAIKKHVERGHVQVHVGLEKSVGPAAGNALNVAALGRWLAAFHEASRILGSTVHPDPNVAMRVPGIMAAESALEWSEELESALTGAFEEALEGLNEFRSREGAAIAVEMRERAHTIESIAARMEAIRETATHAFQQRLTQKLSDLLGPSGSLDPQRLAQEAALLADRSDISEEIMRLKTHAAQLLTLIDAAGEKGKKLDFLLQEMNRETNTILSKTSGLGDHGLTITDLGLAAKAEIDKMREQSLNLE